MGMGFWWLSGGDGVGGLEGEVSRKIKTEHSKAKEEGTRVIRGGGGRGGWRFCNPRGNSGGGEGDGVEKRNGGGARAVTPGTSYKSDRKNN